MVRPERAAGGDLFGDYAVSIGSISFPRERPRRKNQASADKISNASFNFKKFFGKLSITSLNTQPGYHFRQTPGGHPAFPAVVFQRPFRPWPATVAAATTAPSLLGAARPKTLAPEWPSFGAPSGRKPMATQKCRPGGSYTPGRLFSGGSEGRALKIRRLGVG
jgi:hypothetical protein